MGLEDEARTHVAALQGTVAACSGIIDEVVGGLCACFAKGGRVLLCGNGGSAADAQHIAAEFINRLRLDRPALAAVALTTDTSVLTCLANDVGYDEVFARQVEALGRPGDVLVALSTSGSSPNVLAALVAARGAGMTVVGLTGAAGRVLMAPYCDLLVTVPSDDCPRIQECHEFVCHAIAGMVEERLFGAGRAAHAAAESGGR